MPPEPSSPSCGFDGASIAMIAAAADLAPSAVYHYFGGKAALYEEVFDATVEAIWVEVNALGTSSATVLGNVEALVNFALTMSRERREYSNFLALFPMEASLHPEFSYMLDRRVKWQDHTFRALAELGIATGELDGFDVTTGTELMRSLIMGWFFETHIHGRPNERPGESLITLIRILGER